MRTRGFANRRQLLRHLDLHGADFGSATAEEYLALADEFLGGERLTATLECRRRNGETIRYSTATEEFGVVDAAGVILTYFKPRPCPSLTHWEPKVNCHDERDNLTCFKRECGQ